MRKFIKLLVFILIVVFFGIGGAVFVLKFKKDYSFEASLTKINSIPLESEPLLNQEKKSVPKVKFIPSDIVYQGEAFRVELEDFDKLPAVVFFHDKEYPVFFYQDKPTAVIPVAVDEKTGKAEIKIGEEKFLVTIMPGIFQIEEIAPPKPLSPRDLARRAEEKKMIEEAYKDVKPEIFFNSSFIFPLDNLFETSPFGIQRLAKTTGQKISFHNGIDFRAPAGTPVKAVNDGIVALAGNYLFEGGFVIIDHGFGINSVYLHLSQLKVKKDEKVKKGQVIGLSGSSGYSLGPHLHFTVKVNGTAVNPLRFLNLW